MVTRVQTKQSKAIQRKTGRTFHVATRFLPERAREATYVLYAFFRIADEVVDDRDPDPPAVQRQRLERIREGALGRREPEDPIVDAFATVREAAGIPDREVDVFIDAMLADVDAIRYETFADLEGYLRGSAVTVAYMMLEVMDPSAKAQARPHAKALGEAFQLTNFLRDVKEDIQDHGRIYLPRETLERYNLDFEAIEERTYSPQFQRVIEDELARTERRYRDGVAGIHLLPKDCQFPVLLAAILYAEHHAKIRAIGGNVLAERPTLGYRDYARLIVRTWWGWRRLGDPEDVFYRVSAIDPTETDDASSVPGPRRFGPIGSVGRRIAPQLRRWQE